MLREQSSETRVRTCGQERVQGRTPWGSSRVLLVCESLALLRSNGPVSTKNPRRVLKDPSLFEQKVLEMHERQAATPNVSPPSPGRRDRAHPVCHGPGGCSHLIY